MLVHLCLVVLSVQFRVCDARVFKRRLISFHEECARSNAHDVFMHT